MDRDRSPAAFLLWRVLALLSLTLGIIGIALPVLPTVPFLLLAAWAAGRGWPALEAWLLRHPVYGEHILRWRARGAVPRRAKLLATVMMLGSVAMLQFSPAAPWVKLGVPLFLCGVGIWLWTRPES